MRQPSATIRKRGGMRGRLRTHALVTLALGIFLGAHAPSFGVPPVHCGYLYRKPDGALEPLMQVPPPRYYEESDVFKSNEVVSWDTVFLEMGDGKFVRKATFLFHNRNKHVTKASAVTKHSQEYLDAKKEAEAQAQKQLKENNLRHLDGPWQSSYSDSAFYNFDSIVPHLGLDSRAPGQWSVRDPHAFDDSIVESAVLLYGAQEKKTCISDHRKIEASGLCILVAVGLLL